MPIRLFPLKVLNSTNSYNIIPACIPTSPLLIITFGLIFQLKMNSQNFSFCESFWNFVKSILYWYGDWLYLQIGPGIVFLTFHSPIGSGTFVQHLIPTEPLVQKLVHNLYYQKSYPAFIAKFFLLGEAIQVCNLTFIAFAFFMYLPFCRYLNAYALLCNKAYFMGCKTYYDLKECHSTFCKLKKETRAFSRNGHRI